MTEPVEHDAARRAPDAREGTEGDDGRAEDQPLEMDGSGPMEVTDDEA